MVQIAEQFKRHIAALSKAGLTNTLQQVLPRYNEIAAYFRELGSKKLFKDTKPDEVTQKEFNTAMNKVNSDSGWFAWNPIALAYSFIRWIFGSTAQERFRNAVDTLGEYGDDNQAFRFADDTMLKLISELNKRVSSIEGLRSKTFGFHNDSVDQDSTVQSLKKAIKKWLTAYRRIIGPNDSNVRFGDRDHRFLLKQQDYLRVGSHSKYLQDVIGDIDEVLQEWKSHRENSPPRREDLKSLHSSV